jgi:hypothetical protein
LASDSNFDIWGCGPNQTAGTKTLGIAESKYTAMTSMMGTPLPDSGSATNPQEGPDSKIDVYLVSVAASQQVQRDDGTGSTITSTVGSNGGEAWAVNEGGANTIWASFGWTTAASGFIVLNVDALSSATFPSFFRHEFFHVLEFRYNVGDCDGHDWWFTEASATWAESQFASTTAATTTYPLFTTDFQANPAESLLNGETVDPSGNKHAYSSFIWPYFMQQEQGIKSIAGAWKGTLNTTSCSAMNSSVDFELPFDAFFKDFAVRNFDSKLKGLDGSPEAWPQNFTKHYQDLHPNSNFPYQIPTLSPAPILLQYPPSDYTGPYPLKTSVGVSLPPLSSQYSQIKTSNAGSIELDFSGISSASDLDVNLIAADQDLCGTTGYTCNGVPTATPHAPSYILLPVRGNHARVCINQDGSDYNYINPNTVSSAQNPLPIDFNRARFYVLVDNHSMTNNLSGSFTATLRTDCATKLKGTLQFTESDTGPYGSYPISETANYVLQDKFGGFEAAPSGTWSGQVTVPDFPNPPTTCSGSGNIPTSGAAEISINAYDAPGVDVPWIRGILNQESNGSTRPLTCSAGFTTYFQPIFLTSGLIPNCSVPSAGSYGGVYTDSKDTAISFNCTASLSRTGVTINDTFTGTLTATDPMACGLWTPNCNLSAATPEIPGSIAASNLGVKTTAP